jgi:hypothetical protein
MMFGIGIRFGRMSLIGEVATEDEEVYERITEEGDERITEEADERVTES